MVGKNCDRHERFLEKRVVYNADSYSVLLLGILGVLGSHAFFRIRKSSAVFPSTNVFDLMSLIFSSQSSQMPEVLAV